MSRCIHSVSTPSSLCCKHFKRHDISHDQTYRPIPANGCFLNTLGATGIDRAIASNHPQPQLARPDQPTGGPRGRVLYRRGCRPHGALPYIDLRPGSNTLGDLEIMPSTQSIDFTDVRDADAFESYREYDDDMGNSDHLIPGSSLKLTTQNIYGTTLIYDTLTGKIHSLIGLPRSNSCILVSEHSAVEYTRLLLYHFFLQSTGHWLPINSHSDWQHRTNLDLPRTAGRVEVL